MAFKSLVFALSTLKFQGRAFNPASNLVSYIDRGNCGPRGDDAKADLSECGNEWFVKERKVIENYKAHKTVAGCHYFAYTIYECKLPVDPSSLLVRYVDRNSCGPKGDDALADLSQCTEGYVPVHASQRINDDKHRYDVVARKDGCDYFDYIAYECKRQCQSTKKVVGTWESLSKVVGTMTRGREYGIAKTSTHSLTEGYTSELTLGIESSAEASFTIPTASAAKTVKVSANYRHQWSRQFTEELSTSISEKKTFQITVGPEHEGKNLWRFKFTGIDKCDQTAAVIFTQAYAFTDSEAEPPCCYPGHCNDADKASCKWCTPGYKVDPSDARCKEGHESCASGAVVQLPSPLAGYLVLDKEVEHAGKHAMSCPHRFEGTVVLSCHKGDLSVKGHDCVQTPGVFRSTTIPLGTTIPLSSAFLAYQAVPVLMTVILAHHINFW